MVRRRGGVMWTLWQNESVLFVGPVPLLIIWNRTYKKILMGIERRRWETVYPLMGNFCVKILDLLAFNSSGPLYGPLWGDSYVS